MHKLGMEDRSGGRHGERARLKNQMTRLFRCSVQIIYTDGEHEVTVSSFLADRTEYWWNTKRPIAPVLWESKVELGEKFFQEIIAHPIPLDLNTLRAMKRSSLGLDLYFWLVYRTFTLKAPLTLSWRQLYRQFGANPSAGMSTNGFRASCLRELKKIKRAWPDLGYQADRCDFARYRRERVSRTRLRLSTYSPYRTMLSSHSIGLTWRSRESSTPWPSGSALRMTRDMSLACQ